MLFTSSEIPGRDRGAVILGHLKIHALHGELVRVSVEICRDRAAAWLSRLQFPARSKRHSVSTRPWTDASSWPCLLHLALNLAQFLLQACDLLAIAFARSFQLGQLSFHAVELRSDLASDPLSQRRRGVAGLLLRGIDARHQLAAGFRSTGREVPPGGWSSRPAWRRRPWPARLNHPHPSEHSTSD